MDERTLRVLEYDKIRHLVVEAAATAMGKERAQALLPSTDPLQVAAGLAETAEAVLLLRSGSGLPMGGVRDLRAAVKRAGLGGVLDPHELLDAAGTAVAARRLGRVVVEHADEVPNLAAHATQLGTFDALVAEVQRCISDEGQVLDSASSALGDIRRRIRLAQSRVRERLDAMVRSTTLRTYLQEALVTVRDQRYVLPVKAEYRGQVPGVVHDQSASGSTVFIEPMAVVELNNELRQLGLDEEAEVHRILQRLSGLVGLDADLWSDTLAALGQIDFAAAKGQVARQMDALPPAVNADGVVELRRARHPLLGRGAVPIDLHLGRDFDTLLITGPNTGGKTVSLKTVGLLCLMAQSGLHIPAARGSTVPIFAQVFADIGDEQSIEQSLSTFSSHMTAIVRLLDGLDPGALVLLDEVGAGTDPTEGAALGRAVLEHLHARGARVMATTHYPDLKAWAAAVPWVANGSVEFDVDTLRPTYRLLIGVPGASCAFEISQRLGLSPVLVERARTFISAEAETVESLLQQIQSTRNQVEAERTAAAADRRRAEALLREAEQRLEAARARERDTLQKARDQAQELLRQVRVESEAIIGELRSALANQRSAEQAEAIESARRRLKAARGLTAGAGAGALGDDAADGADGAATPPQNLRPGEAVRIKSVDARGHVLAPPDDSGNVQVQAGLLKVTVPLADLVRVQADAAPARPQRSPQDLPAGATGLAGFGQGGVGASTGSARAGAGQRGGAGPGPAAGGGWSGQGGHGTGTDGGRFDGAGGAAGRLHFSTELDLRGLTVEEALNEVDKYVDDAILAGAAQVRIIHGKGTGALRKAVQDYLRGHGGVTSFRLGTMGEGGDGVTVARFGE